MREAGLIPNAYCRPLGIDMRHAISPSGERTLSKRRASLETYSRYTLGSTSTRGDLTFPETNRNAALGWSNTLGGMESIRPISSSHCGPTIVEVTPTRYTRVRLGSTLRRPGKISKGSENGSSPVKRSGAICSTGLLGLVELAFRSEIRSPLTGRFELIF